MFTVWVYYVCLIELSYKDKQAGFNAFSTTYARSVHSLAQMITNYKAKVLCHIYIVNSLNSHSLV